MKISELISAIDEFKSIRKVVTDWMLNEAKQGRFRVNNDCPKWGDYENAERMLWNAINSINGWDFNLDDNTQSQCTNCGRNRVSLCLNGKHRCEKCDFSPEEQRVITDQDMENQC